MLKDECMDGTNVVGLRTGAIRACAFETSVYAAFWRDASKAVAMSRRGNVHLVREVKIEVLKALHAESMGKGSTGKMPIAVVCRDHESLGGPMMKNIRRTGAGWLMGDGTLVKFFSEMPGPEEGPVKQPVTVQVSDEVRLEMEQLDRAMRARAAALKMKSSLSQ